MIEIQIISPTKQKSKAQLVPGLYRVGTSTASHIQLPYPGISTQHCQFLVTEHDIKVIDLNSTNGTTIDGVPAPPNTPTLAPIGSVIGLAEVQINVIGPEIKKTPEPIAPKEHPVPTTSTASQPPKSTPQSEPTKQSAPSINSNNESAIPVLKISGISAEARPFVQEVKKRAHVELLKRLNLKHMAVSGSSEEELESKAKETIHEIISALSVQLPAGVTREIIERELINEAIGLGPLEDLIAVDEITEIMVNGPNQVFVEKSGKIYKTDTAFADDYQVQAAIERIVSPLGRRIDESSPMVDARLKDGSRVNAIIPPLSLTGPTITIRKFSKVPLQATDLINFGSISEDMIKFLRICVLLRKNILISGGTGSGKTTLLNILSSFLPNAERIITIEDAAELQLNQEHVIRLESRPPNIEGKGAIMIRDLVRNSLRMRPDRIVIGECRGGEALDMLQAMNTGHDGSLTTIHANTPRDCLARLETLVLMAGFDLPLRAIREQIASAINIVVQITREKDGSRKVLSISEITKMEGDIITMQDIFQFKQDGWSDDDKIVGRYLPTGNIPTFMQDVRRAKLELDIGMFSKKDDYKGENF